MKKKIIGISILMLSLVFVIVVYINRNEKNTFTENGVTYALTVNGSSATSFPSRGMYRVDVECQNAECRWDYNNWKLIFGKITGSVLCNITFTTISKTYLNNKITSLSGTTQGTGQVVNENGYRYEGKDPNNYISFNNELWRIIGVFDSVSHGVANTNLVKIIRDEPLGGLVWNKTNTNDWSASSLKKLWNPIDGDSASGSYYNKTNGTGNTYCYGYSTTIPGNCNYSGKGIDETYRGMVKNVTWYLGGWSTNTITTTAMYGYERDSTMVYGSNPASDTGYIGLMYASDYGYSVLASSCARTTSLSSYNKASCSGQSWLYGNGFEWTITPASNNSNNTLCLHPGGHGSYSSSYSSYESRPVLYLDTSVYYLDGDGSISDPYIIGM